MGSNPVEALQFFSGLNLQSFVFPQFTCLNCGLKYNCDGQILTQRPFHLYFRNCLNNHLYFIFLSRVKINSINWPAPNIWVFIAQLVEHCSANAEAMGSNPVEALQFFSGLNLQLLKLRLQLRWSNLYFICISAVHIIFISYSCHGLK